MHGERALQLEWGKLLSRTEPYCDLNHAIGSYSPTLSEIRSITPQAMRGPPETPDLAGPDTP
jgi:hypothetical protein